MRDRIFKLTTAVTLLASNIGLAQSMKPDSDSLVARLSYERTSVVWREQQGPPRVCLALYQSGRYQLLMDTDQGTQFLQGTLSRNQFSRLSRMLEDLDFRSSGVGTVRQGSESFEAEVHRAGETRRYRWVDPDHQRPFPEPAMSIVRWLRNFKAQGATPLSFGESSERQVCPAEKPLLPVIAGLAHKPDADPCGRRRI